MAAGLLIFPGAQPSRSRQGTVVSAELRWYLNETTTPATVYTDPARVSVSVMDEAQSLAAARLSFVVHYRHLRTDPSS